MHSFLKMQHFVIERYAKICKSFKSCFLTLYLIIKSLRKRLHNINNVFNSKKVQSIVKKITFAS